jgi:hypothetical protein
MNNRRGSSSYIPYSENNVGGSVYTNEGFQSINYSDDNDQNNNIIDANNVPKCIQLPGWKGDGVFCHPNGGLEQLDLYSHAKGDISCDRNSSGYHNSKGGLCLDSKMMQLLRTRGMNAVGGYGQIGTGEA